MLLQENFWISFIFEFLFKLITKSLKKSLQPGCFCQITTERNYFELCTEVIKLRWLLTLFWMSTFKYNDNFGLISDKTDCKRYYLCICIRCITLLIEKRDEFRLIKIRIWRNKLDDINLGLANNSNGDNVGFFLKIIKFKDLEDFMIS